MKGNFEHSARKLIQNEHEVYVLEGHEACRCLIENIQSEVLSYLPSQSARPREPGFKGHPQMLKQHNDDSDSILSVNGWAMKG